MARECKLMRLWHRHLQVLAAARQQEQDQQQQQVQLANALLVASLSMGPRAAREEPLVHFSQLLLQVRWPPAQTHLCANLSMQCPPVWDARLLECAWMCCGLHCTTCLPNLVAERG